MLPGVGMMAGALMGHVTHVLNIYSILNMAYKMFVLSRKESTDNDYNKCFVYILLAALGPFIIWYSTYMNLLYHKGFYTDQYFAGIGFVR